MSQYIFKDFGYMSMIRQHILNTHYEMAFPPIFPFLMAILNSILDMGIMSAFLLNLLSGLLLIGLFKNIGDCSGYRLELSVALLTFVCTSLFRNIFLGGLTQLLGFTFFAVIIRLLVKEKFSVRDCFISAMLAGIGLMNRFDFLAITGTVLVLTPFNVNVLRDGREEKIKIKYRLIWLFINILIVFIVCLPWISYSVNKFDKIFVTDNGRRLINIEDTRPSTYFSADSPALTMFDDFRTWVLAFRGREKSVLQSLKMLINNYYIFKNFTIALLCIIVAVLLYFLIQKNKGLKELLWLLVKKYFGIIIIALSIICQEITIIFTGYEDSRYHMLFLLLINILTLVAFKTVILNGCQKIKRMNKYKKIVVMVLEIVFLYDGYHMLQNSLPYIFSQGLSGENTLFIVKNLTEQEIEIDNYLYEQNASCMVINRNEKSINVPRTCSLIRTAAMISPSNINLNNAATFVKDFNIDYFFSSDQALNDIFSDTVGITETSIENLYRIGKE